MAELSTTIWQDEPAWLQKKRQLAKILRPRFRKIENQELWLNKGPAAVPAVSRGWLNHRGTFTALPLEQAVANYSELLQENLMEKAIRWQDSQLNANHLAHIAGGQYIYVPDNYHSSRPLSFAPVHNLTDPHNLIIVGANSRVIIQEEETFESRSPVFGGTEILLGTNAHVVYRQRNHYHDPLTYLAIHAYQAHGAELDLELAVTTANKVVTSLYSFLDGAGTHWDAQLALQTHADGQIALSPVLDGFGVNAAGKLRLWTQAASGALKLAKLKTGSGEPLALSEQHLSVEVNKELAAQLPAGSWLRKIVAD